MKRNKLRPAQVVKVLQQHGAGKPPAEVWRADKISHATLYDWKKRLGGMGGRQP